MTEELEDYCNNIVLVSPCSYKQAYFNNMTKDPVSYIGADLWRSV